MYKIYTITNPLTNEIFYVGKTVQKLDLRLSAHCSELTNIRNYPNRKKMILQQIMSAGLVPIIEELCSVDKEFGEQEEVYWIEQFKNWGFPLTNREVNKQQNYEVIYNEDFKYGICILKNNNMKKNCLACNNEFEGNRKSIFCSDECKHKYSKGVSLAENKKNVAKNPDVISDLIKSGTITTADKVPVPEPKIFDADKVENPNDELNFSAPRPAWVKMVEDFCNKEGITHEELIEGYKLSKSGKKVATVKKQGNEIILQDFTKENAVGKPYNPQNNWLYKAKMAKTGKGS